MKVVIFSCSTGGGHNSCARYIEDELQPMNVTVVWQDFESGPPMNQSLAAGLSDIGVIGDVPTVTALSAGNAMKLVGIPASGPDAYAMLARADDKSFKSSADMPQFYDKAFGKKRPFV